MKQEIKNNELRERQKYVPASMKVITISVQRVICQSPGDGTKSMGFEDLGNGGFQEQ